ncbi:predicted protein [Sparassis crispa]|uniref:FAD dependent oxidoreductase domain-containing protein n=1 Tax=Sparassis crispa TaxID=139825 RepID=A0A401H4U4_9APHY|nr:predicted protein [Sparassis crispa]GBE89423.1 predicted protein [Sparassis crispa]
MSALPVPLNVRAEDEAILKLPSEHGPASLPVSNSTRSFWIDTPGANPHASDGSDGTLTTDADICIIGSGITGVSAAYHLSQLLANSTASARPLKAVILEARDFCSGATGRNGGHLAPHAFSDFRGHAEKHGTAEALRAVAMEFYTASEIVKIIKEKKKESIVDLVEGGRMELLISQQEVVNEKANYEAAKAAGANVAGVTWLTKEEVEARYGAPYPGVNMESHNLWPLKAVAFLYELASSSPDLVLTLHTRTPVTSITPLESEAGPTSRRWNVNTPRGAIACSYVLHATNAYASHLLLHLQGPAGIVPTRGQIIAVRADAPEEKVTKSGYIANEGLEYWFPRPVEANQTSPLVILGGGREVAPKHEFHETDDSVLNKQVGAVLRKFLPSVFPSLYNVKEPEMEWTGIMGFTASGDPFVGPVVDPADPASVALYKGQYISAGYSGHGMPRAFACAEVVAQMIVADITGKSWTAPSWLPHHYLTTYL